MRKDWYIKNTRKAKQFHQNNQPELMKNEKLNSR